MNLWMVIFIGGRIFAVWHDPMPADMTPADCQIHADRWTESQARKLDPEDQPVFACLQRWLRPRRGELARAIALSPSERNAVEIVDSDQSFPKSATASKVER